MRGRKPVPDVIKIAKGTLRKCRQKKNAPVQDGTPKCPFNITSIAGRKWKEVTEGLKRLGLIDKIDGTHIEGLCRNYQIAKEADKDIEKNGMVLLTPSGNIIKNPSAAIASDAWSKVRMYGNDLGLNHLSRQRMESNAEPAETSIEDKYLA